MAPCNLFCQNYLRIVNFSLLKLTKSENSETRCESIQPSLIGENSENINTFVHRRTLPCPHRSENSENICEIDVSLPIE